MLNVSKFIVLLLTLVFSFNYAGLYNIAFSKEEITAQISEQITLPVIPIKAEKEIKSALSKIYGPQNVDIIYSNIERIAEETKLSRPQSLKNDDLQRTDDWYKDEVIYMFYADQFGVKNTNTPNTFKDDIKMLDYLKDLGVTTIYILPFADSPMKDSGFDVRNPRDIRADLGGMKEFKEFVTAAREKGFKIKADLVLNHFSDEHVWFKDAQNGDLEKLNYFVVTEQMPEYTTYKDEKLGQVVEYKEPDGKISKRRLIFPEITENHYRRVTINDKDYYLYHTFYPFQLDINWKNPQVLYYNLETISFWANLGIDIFRMDAIPYLIKEEGTNAENLANTHRIIKILSLYIQSVAPRSVIQAEACQFPNKILPYFGTEQKIKPVINGEQRELTRTDEVQIAYHFPYMPAIWASLVSGDNSYFWKAYKHTPQIPNSAAWAIFLRVHDELTLEMVNSKTRELLFEDLAPKGAGFRKGFGVSGRMASFLDNNPDRIGMAFSILLSLPGIPIIYYGDEVGIQNNFANAKPSAGLRGYKQIQGKNKVKLLSYFGSRGINRGPITEKTFKKAVTQKGTFNNKVYERVKKLITLRKNYPVMTRGNFTELKTGSPEVFAYMRTLDNTRVVVINNLSNKRIKATVYLSNDDFGKKTKEIYFNDLLTDKKTKAQVKEKQITVRLKPYDAMWLKM